VSAAVGEQILQALDELGGVDWIKKLSPGLFASLIRAVTPRTVHQDSTIRFEDGLAEIEKGQEELGTDEIGLTPIGDAENGDTPEHD